MKVYFFQHKKKFPRALKWAYLSFIGCWIMAFSFEFLSLELELFNLLIPLSLIPLALIIGIPLIRFFESPYVNVESPEKFSLRLNTKLPLEELSRALELAETGNYLYYREPRKRINEITRKSAIRLARAFPLMEMQIVPQQQNFRYTRSGKWLIYIAKPALGIFLLGTLLIGFIFYPFFNDIVMPWDKPNAVEAVEEWGGLADLPVNISQMDIDTEGGMFTRTFIIQFQTNPDIIKAWIEESYGIREVAPIREGDLYIYHSTGYEEAIGGTIKVDYETGTVIIKMSWS